MTLYISRFTKLASKLAIILIHLSIYFSIMGAMPILSAKCRCYTLPKNSSRDDPTWVLTGQIPNEI